ncbi:transposase [Spirillospora sp. CA-255316]
MWQRDRDRPPRARRPERGSLIHHSDRGCQYTSFRYATRLADLGVVASVGSVADSYDNAMAEALNGTFKAELINRQTWRTRDQVEYAIVEWIGWYNHCRLHSAIGNVPPAEYTRQPITVRSTHQRQPAPGKPDFTQPGAPQ